MKLRRSWISTLPTYLLVTAWLNLAFKLLQSAVFGYLLFVGKSVADKRVPLNDYLTEEVANWLSRPEVLVGLYSKALIYVAFAAFGFRIWRTGARAMKSALEQEQVKQSEGLGELKRLPRLLLTYFGVDVLDVVVTQLSFSNMPDAAGRSIGMSGGVTIFHMGTSIWDLLVPSFGGIMSLLLALLITAFIQVNEDRARLQSESALTV